MARQWVWFPNLKPGKTNNSVKIIQRHLGVTPVSGFYGPVTRATVAKYQRSLGLKGDDADGVFGSWSIRKLAAKKGFDVKGLTNPVKTVGAKVTGGRAPSPVPGRGVSFPYGVRRRSYAAGFHTGDDFAAPHGARVVAVRSGRVRRVWGGAYGNVALLSTDTGRDLWYCHLSRYGKSGRVKAGDTIGYVGSTGNATGPHVHLEDRPRGGGYGQVRKPRW